MSNTQVLKVFCLNEMDGAIGIAIHRGTIGSLGCARNLFFKSYRKLAGVVAGGGDGNFASRLLADALECFAPLDQDQRVWSEQLVEAKGFQLTFAFKAIDVEVEEFDRLAVLNAVVLVDQGECWAGDLVGLGGVEGLGDSFDESGLSGTEVAAEDQQLGSHQKTRQHAAPVDRIRTARGLELMGADSLGGNFGGGGCGVGHLASSSVAAIGQDSAVSPCNQTYPF